MERGRERGEDNVSLVKSFSLLLLSSLAKVFRLASTEFVVFVVVSAAPENSPFGNFRGETVNFLFAFRLALP